MQWTRLKHYFQMTKVEELLDSIWRNEEERYQYDDIQHIMQEYAEYYAKKCLEIAVNEVDCGNVEDFQYDIARESILNIKLPEHE